MKKSMKTKLAMFAVAGVMAVSGTVGIAAPAKAGNTTNDEFKYNSNSPAGISRWRDKENATKVYILFICCTLNLTFFSESFIFSVKNDSKKVQLSYKYRFILLLGVFSNSFG